MAKTLGLPVETLRWTNRQRECLVFIRADAAPRTLAWIDFSKPRSWDLLVAHYERPANVEPGAEMVTFGGVSKFPTVWEINERHDHFLSGYRASLFLDDDIEIRFEDVERLFALFSQYKLELAQPALSLSSYSSWPITLQSPGYKLRYTNFVEIMSPIFSAAALALCLKTFWKSISGWGLDLVWPSLLGEPANGIAIIDEVTVTHTRAVDPQQGRFYKYLRSLGIDPYDELRRLLEEYGLPADFETRQYGGIALGEDGLDKTGPVP